MNSDEASIFIGRYLEVHRVPPRRLRKAAHDPISGLLAVTDARSSGRQRASPRRRCKKASCGVRSGLVLSCREETVDREEAIKRLRSQGVNAPKRDWAFGGSIVIPVGPAKDGSGIIVYRKVFYLYHGPDGSLEFLKCPDGSTSRYPDLEVPVRATLDTIIGLRPS
jgi:hypothetical protein